MENYFWNTEESYGKKNFILVIYDIVDNKRRVRFAKKMEGYGFRVQKSAFEALLPESIYQKLIKEIPGYIDAKEDSVRIYRMTGYGEVKMFGQNVTLSSEDVIVI
ncbi:MAG: CRISPR-associated endonuclease Cas2 [Anaerobutyricum sp.]|nr:CRISPR-associated endonuclease Cas2 [Anaerobutyricum sp.]